MGNKQFKKLKGFTLVELITVVAIISMIAIYITIEINRSSDDAKIGIATAYLTSSVPAAISSYRARHLGNCNSIGTTNAEVLASLEARGMSDTSPWGDAVTAAWDNTAKQITITFTIPGTNADTVGSDLITNLMLSSGQFATDPTNSSGLITAIYDCA